MYPGVRIIGLTGGIASGKSSVAGILEEFGVPVIDADQLAREAVSPGSRSLARIAEVFGDDVLAADGTLDRKRLGSLVFGDPEKRRRLEGILHPEIRRLGEERIAKEVAAGHDLLVYMAPLLIEAGAVDRVDEIWVVTVRPEVQLERLMARDGIGRDEALRIIDSQMPLAEKAAYGRVLIDNSGTPEETRRIVLNIWKKEAGEHR
ncbi:MAG: dephospho-CoA kinase [Deltaproteobacteria bacterium]|nr:dephospho-CoA kinase [Deltaproteobacteria bacterium]